MIILKDTKLNFKKNIQFQYNKMISTIDFSQIYCSCNHHDWKQHCRYNRYVDFFGFKIKIKILRIRCNHCGKTHAVLFECIIPFSSINQTEALLVLNKSLYVDMSYFAFLKKKFSFNLLYDYSSLCLFASRNFPVIFFSLNF